MSIISSQFVGSMCVGEGFNGVNATHVPQLSVESFKLRKLLRDIATKIGMKR